MDELAFRAALEGLPIGRTALLETIGSTNDLAAEWAGQVAPDFSLILADEQTKGRGRAGRRWLTPRGSALAFSLLLDPAALPQAEPGLVTGLGAVAAAEALETLFGLQPEIKWPNDVLLGGRKVCGVLAEAHWAGAELQAIILGIGMNVAPSSVPPPEALALPATCVEAETGQPCDRPMLLRGILESLLRWRPRLGQPAFVAAWEERLAYRGQAVALVSGAEELHGRLLGLAPDGQLRLEDDARAVRQVPAGEIRLRPKLTGK
ncbi:MAG: biotin--[acetyl-CoA-carboxylase] ligase [Anaerolineae bacterium]|nr:MAG: biotin--[acetyl-CoA-carboxylase] ligase [Anaerolineae bacterium]